MVLRLVYRKVVWTVGLKVVKSALWRDLRRVDCLVGCSVVSWADARVARLVDEKERSLVDDLADQKVSSWLESLMADLSVAKKAGWRDGD